MDDAQIVQLYWDRDEQAIPAISDKYGNYALRLQRTYWEIRKMPRNVSVINKCLGKTSLCSASGRISLRAWKCLQYCDERRDTVSYVTD